MEGLRCGIEDVDLAVAYAYPKDGPWLRANMITSLDGAAWLDERSGGLGGPADQLVFSTLRGLADAIIVGAGTVRTEDYGPVRSAPGWHRLRTGRSPEPRLVIVSGRLVLDLNAPVFTESAEPPIVITSAAAPPELRRAAAEHCELIVAGDERVDLPAALSELTRRGYPRTLCEGGPRLLAQITATGLLDELCMTLSPLLTAGDAARILDGPDLPKVERLRLGHVLTGEDFLFLRYSR
ncbi:pyrimidine reductase family protein [Actinomadura scrupuli]|uniref:pyrimidine reductase family protein n=1 Tax=Actinomadura scrupuli TaxID=559629 RepID=UPI003D95875D